MSISLFRSTKEPDVFGFTADPTGTNLPNQFAPWQKSAGGTAAQAYAGSSLDGLAASDPVEKAVEQDGFYLVRSGWRFHPQQALGASIDGTAVLPARSVDTPD